MSYKPNSVLSSVYMDVSNQAISRRVTIKTLVSARYKTSERPRTWDERIPGVDVVETTDGETLNLLSNAQQSPPQEGWVILLTSKNETSSYSWTLYGMPKGAGLAGLNITQDYQSTQN